MGKGDKKSKKGKLWRGSYGNSRNRKAIQERMMRAASKKVAKPASSESSAKPKRSPKKKADA